MADAVARGCRNVITCGSAQSNHCRAVAAACAQLGLKSHLFLRSDIQRAEELPLDGNLLLNKLFGSSMYLIERKSKYLSHIRPKMLELADRIRYATGDESYLIPVGGSDSVGVWGYLECFWEIIYQAPKVTDIVCVLGSGGSGAGLAIANFLCDSPYRCHGISVCDNDVYFHRHVDEMLEKLGLSDQTCSRDIITIHDNYKGPGYGRNELTDFEFIAQVASQAGLLVDNVYTGKALRGLVDLIRNHSHVFKGDDILFIHSGGATSLQSSSVTASLLPFIESSRIQCWE